MSRLYACARPPRSPASSHSRSRRRRCAPPARPGSERGRRRPSSPRPYEEPVVAPAEAPCLGSPPCITLQAPSSPPVSGERGPAVLAGRSASPASAATRAERASRAAALRDTVARMNVNPRCSPLFGIRAGSRWGKREPVLPFAFCSSPSPPHSWQRARAAPAVRRAQLPAWLQRAACCSGAGKSPSHAIVRLLSDKSDS